MRYKERSIDRNRTAHELGKLSILIVRQGTPRDHSGLLDQDPKCDFVMHGASKIKTASSKSGQATQAVAAGGNGKAPVVKRYPEDADFPRCE